jgi:hypothetical protein
MRINRRQTADFFALSLIWSGLERGLWRGLLPGVLPVLLLVGLAVSPCFSSTASAANARRAAPMTMEEREKQAYRILPNTAISVVAYNKKSQTFTIRMEAEPAVGPNVTTLEWLLEGIESDQTKTFKRYPSRLVGGNFTVKKTLWLLNEDEIASRKASLTKKK